MEAIGERRPGPGRADVVVAGTATVALPPPDSERELEEYLSRPTPGSVAALRELEGDVLILGAGGKMGLDLARLARRSREVAGTAGRVIAVSRFGDGAVAERFRQAGVEMIATDLMADGALEALPEAPHVIFMAGKKFGASGAPSETWALNTFLPGLVARRFARARIAIFSTGNVYPLTEVRLGGPTEEEPPAPVGEYAQSCLGRERLFEYFAARHGTPLAIVRLNYANDLRYGVLLDLAQKVAAGASIDLAMGHVNVIWQGDANAMVLQALAAAGAPPLLVNVSGPEFVSVRWAATRLAELLGTPPPTFVGTETPTALLSNCARAHARFGYPTVPLGVLLTWTAHWVRRGGQTLNKPTHFETRDGRF